MQPIRWMFGIVAVLALSSTAFGQATAQISGTVQDATGALIPGAEVTVTQIDTGANRLAVTNETGSYVITSLPIGPYRLEAVLPGFQTFVQTGIVLQVNGAPVVNVTLNVGQVTQNHRGAGERGHGRDPHRRGRPDDGRRAAAGAAPQRAQRY